jgi:aminoglycoside phosphotransferase (APT) family kinase protein
MTFVEGTSFEPLFDPDEGQDENAVAEAVGNAARVLAALHALDPADLGVGSEPAIAPGGEIDRWCQLLETIDPALVPGWREVADSLRGVEPAPAKPTVVHGDFRLGNMLTERGRIAAVVDWEIWSVGDPRFDLGWFLVNAEPATYRRPTRFAGALPHPDELAALYTGSLGRKLPDLPWFQALACFKSTATWSLIVKHNRRRSAPDPALEEMARTLPHLLGRAMGYLG